MNQTATNELRKFSSTLKKPVQILHLNHQLYMQRA